MGPEEPLTDLKAERHLLWETLQEMLHHGLVAGSSGNASMRLTGDRHDGQVLITPHGLPYGRMSPDDLVVIDLAGEPVQGELFPSTETALHLALYGGRPDVGAVVHTHSPFASVMAVAGLELPPVVDEMVVKVGGAVRVARYGFPSSVELAQAGLEALGERNAVLLRNHGLVGVGRTLEGALETCQLVERVAQVFVYASLLGRANPLPAGAVQIQRSLFQMQTQVEPRGQRKIGGETGDGDSP
jgi:L-fuculose-phosphate aldolase